MRVHTVIKSTKFKNSFQFPFLLINQETIYLLSNNIWEVLLKNFGNSYVIHTDVQIS
jgi:hypothetical protein